MKDNLIRILAAILLLLCFASTSNLWGQVCFSEPAFTDPHDPALGGDATMSILPDRPFHLKSSREIPSDGTDAQTDDFQKLNPAISLHVQSGCYYFLSPCNLNPAICNLRPEVSGRNGYIFDATGKREIYMAWQLEAERPVPPAPTHIKMWKQR